MVLNGTNTYDGNTVVNDGALEVTASGSLHFRPTTNGSHQLRLRLRHRHRCPSLAPSISTSPPRTPPAATFGTSSTSAASPPRPSVTPAAVTSTLGSFTEVTSGVWELPVTGAKWVFTEADGNLAYVDTATDYDTWETANGVTGGEND